jgi:sulfide dehydrogenase [flavocytochrome c] flavoprotein chain
VNIDATTKLVSYVDQLGVSRALQARVVNPIVANRATGSEPGGWLAAAGLNNGPEGRWANVDLLSYASTAAGAGDIHVIGDAANTGMPKAGHVANQEAKICTDAILRLLAGTAPDPQPVANSACFSPITATTASWLTAVYQYDPATARMKIAAQGGQTTVNGVPAAATEAASASTENFEDMGVWFTSLMSDTAA